MNSEKIKKVTSEAINQLAEALSSGRSDTFTRYLAAMARFRAYSFLNVLLILKQRPDASRVAGYRTWQSFGRQVRQGEKGIMIFAPLFVKRTEATRYADNADSPFYLSANSTRSGAYYRRSFTCRQLRDLAFPDV